jgi:hypothetical protein
MEKIRIRDGKNSDWGWKKFGFGSATLLEDIYNILGVSDPNWFQCGSGSRFLMTRSEKKFTAETLIFFYIKNCNSRIPRPP